MQQKVGLQGKRVISSVDRRGLDWRSRSRRLRREPTS
jgi:hypothetical protein